MKNSFLPFLFFTLICSIRAVQASTPSSPLPDTLSISLDSANSPTCLNGNDGALFISITGGTAPYSFLWSNGEITEDLAGLPAGLYSVTVTDDDNNTAALEDILLPDPINPVNASLVYTELPSCTGQLGALGVQVSGGVSPFQLAWSNGETSDTITDLTAGIYDLLVTDSNGCEANYSYVLQPLFPAISLSADGDVTCSHPTAQLDGSASVLGPNTIFEWSASNGGEFSSPTDSLVVFTEAAGTYTLTLTDTLNGCVATADIDIAVDTLAPIIDAGLDINAPCTNSALTLGGSVSADPSHTLDIQWTSFDGGNIVAGDNTLTPNIDHAGTYVLTVQIVENGCSATDTTLVTGDNDPPMLVVAGGTLTCFVPAVQLSAQVDTMDTSFGWAGPNSFTSDELNPSVSEAGNFVFTVTDTLTTCTSVATAVVLANNLPPIITVTGGQITCADTSAILSFTASSTDISVSWVGPNGFTSDEANPVAIEGGDYTLTVTDTLNGCSATAVATVTVDTLAPSADAGADVNALCTNTALSLQGFGGAGPNYSLSYHWTTFDGGHIFLGANTLTPDIDHAGTYVLTVQIVENGCSATDTTLVTGDNDPPMLAVAGGTLTCFSPTVQLLAVADTMNTNFGWAGPNGFVADVLDTLVMEAGDYVFTITDTVTTCTSVATASVLADNEPPTLTVNGGSVTCTNATVVLNFTASSNDISWTWDGPNGFTSTEPSPEVAEPGDYTLSVMDTLNGCSAMAITAVTMDTLAPIADAGADATLTCIATSLQLSGTTTSLGSEFSYAWTTADGNITAGVNTDMATVDAGGTYVLTVTNTVNGCTAFDEVLVDENNTAPTVLAHGGTITCTSPSVMLTGIFIPNNTVFGWTGPNGFTSSVPTPIVSVQGDYILTVTDTLNGCSAAAVATVDESILLPNLTATGGFIGCNAAPVTLNAFALGTVTYAWTGPNGFSSNQQNPSVSATGNYTVTATNSINGCSSSATVAVTLNTTPPVANAGAGFNLNCHVSSGKLNGTGSSQGAGFTYAWTTVNGNITAGANTLMPTVNAVGTYVLTVTNQANGCTASASTTVTLSPPVTVSVTSMDATCFAFPSGSATATPSGGTGFYSYTWSNGVHVQTANGLMVGTYTVTISDGNGCTATGTATIGQPATALNLAISATPQSAPGMNDGTANVNVTGGNAPYFYNWNSGQTTPNITGLAPGAYTVSVSDMNNCSASATVNVNAAACSLTASISTTNANCFGSATGSATVTVNNQMPPVQYNWSNGSTQATANNLAAGAYSVSVSDASGCSQFFNFTIAEPSQLTVVELFHNDASCPGGVADGTVTAAVNGGTQPYTYAWTNGSSAATAGGLSVGTYTLSVTDANGCQTTMTSTIVGTDTEPPVLELTNALASLDDNGQVTITAQMFDAGSSDNCGIANMTVSPSTFDCSQIGTFTVTITATDMSGLQSVGIAEVTVEDKIAPTVVCPSNISVSACNTTVDFALPTVSDNCGVDIALLSQTAGLPSGSDFPIGTTTVQTFSYTDASGNTGTCSFNVTVENTLTYAAVLSDITCAGACDGAVNVSVSGGLQPVTITWSNGGDGTGLCAGNYSATVSDAGGCSSTMNFTINEPQPLTLSLTSTNPACANDNSGTIQAVVTGGNGSYNFDWTNGSTGDNLTGLGSGVYTVIVTDFNGCSLSETVTLVATDTEAPTLVLQNASVALGTNGSVTLDPALFDAGSTDNCGIANWNVSPNTFDCGDLGVHVVTLTATDGSGNSSTNTAMVTVTDNIVPVITCPANVAISYCNPTATFALPTVTDNCTLNPALLIQTNGLPSGSDFPAGITTQTFSYTDLAGNNATCSFTVTVSPAAMITPSFTNATCNGTCNGTASVAISGGLPPFSVLWSNGQIGTTATNLCSGAYEASVTDGAGCLQTLTFTITEPTALELTVDQVVNDVNGAGVGAAQISVTGGVTPYTYAWTRNGQPFSTSQDLINLMMGDYVVVITDANGCSITSMTVTVQNLTGVNEPSWGQGAILQPNPASGQTTIVLQNPLPQALEVQLFDITGKLVKRQQFVSQTDRLSLDLTGLAAGVYNVQLRSAGGVAMRRLVVGN
ncbi:MAG: HYR domain-containing protein [Bacteroidetes bacterium]|nr:HYR domain-containing protein [Bacteroidota bacterium]